MAQFSCLRLGERRIIITIKIPELKQLTKSPLFKFICGGKGEDRLFPLDS